MRLLILFILLPFLIALSCSDKTCVSCEKNTCALVNTCDDSNCLACRESRHSICNKCSANFYLDNFYNCVSCSKFYNCLDNQCTIKGCDRCSDDRYLLHSFFANGNSYNCFTCDEVYPQCTTCLRLKNNLPECNKCSSNYYRSILSGYFYCQKCRNLVCSPCPSNENNYSTCADCVGESYVTFVNDKCGNKFRNDSPTKSVCSIDKCNDCYYDHDKENVFCSRCQNGYNLLDSRLSCESICPVGSYYKNRSCSSCGEIFKGCTECNSDGCLKCDAKTVLDFNNKGFGKGCVCPEGHVEMFDTCVHVAWPITVSLLTSLLLIVVIAIIVRKYRNRLLLEAEMRNLNFNRSEFSQILSTEFNWESRARKLTLFVGPCTHCYKKSASYESKPCGCKICIICLQFTCIVDNCVGCVPLIEIQKRAVAIGNELKGNDNSFEVCSVCLSNENKITLACGNRHSLCIPCYGTFLKNGKSNCHLCRNVYDPSKSMICSE